MNGLEQRLLTEPDYRPYCLSCSTMQRMTLVERDGQRFMYCEPKPENHEGAKILSSLGFAPRIGCGIEYNISTGKVTQQKDG